MKRLPGVRVVLLALALAVPMCRAVAAGGLPGYAPGSGVDAAEASRIGRWALAKPSPEPRSPWCRTGG